MKTAPQNIDEPASNRRILWLEWPRHVTTEESRTLLVGSSGWTLEAFDIALYTLVLAWLIRNFTLSSSAAGLLTSLMLLSYGIGGSLFGVFADRVGRKRTLMASIMIYVLASFACGISHTFLQLAIFRFLLGLGMGGQWTCGAALIAETWRSEHRGKALGLMQSTWAVGEIVAAIVAGVMFARFDWHDAFFVGLAPAIFLLWMQSRVSEPPIWESQAGSAQARFAESLRILGRKDLRRNGVLVTAMNACTMFGYWGLFTWIPAYLSLPAAQGGRGLNLTKTATWLVAMGIGKWMGYTLFGFTADSIGRRRTYVAYLLAAAILVPVYGISSTPGWLLVVGPLVAFFGTGYFSGFGAITSEIFPTEIRATAMGITYNIGRAFSALAPFTIGLLSRRFGLGPSFVVLAAAFLLAAFFAMALPETKGKQLE
ncbi:MAG TPA: MFS transporter [Candidatus Acidoferrales bacterium]|nr:MFS transporter [Candidatus Acidoferrales bacterium]